MRIRPATADDLPFLAEMLVEAGTPPWVDPKPTPTEFLAHPQGGLYLRDWGRAGDHGVVAEDASGRALGAAWYRHFAADAPGYGFVSEAIPELTIAVAHHARGLGVGRQLMAGLIDVAQSAGEPALSLDVSSTHPAALGLYRSAGFARVGGPDENPIMLRSLGPGAGRFEASPRPDRSVLIDDPRLAAIPIVDSGEPLQDIRAAGLLVDRSRSRIQRVSDNPFLVRQGVVERLGRADGLLPRGVHLQVKEGWRPIAVQAQIFGAFLAELRAERPDVTEHDLRAEAVRFVAPPDGVPPHSTGGAVDVVLVHDGDEFDMGSQFNAPGPAASTVEVGLASEAIRHRQLLAAVLGAAGFVNYAHEWWHWSYGDRLWAYLTDAAGAIYGPMTGS